MPRDAGRSGAGAMGSVDVAPTATDAQGAGIPAVWDHEADLVILGAGCTGIAAALEADGLGGSVIILEEQPEELAGGDSVCNGGLLYSAAFAPDALATDSFDALDRAWVTAVSEESGKVLPWFVAHGATFEAGTAETALPFIEGNGVALYDILEKALAGTSASVLYGTHASGLVTRPGTNEVLGVRATRGDSQVTVRANKGVLIATGSYTANKDLVREFNLPGVDYYSYGAPNLTGDGLIMGIQAGASLWRMAKSLEWHPSACKVASEEVGYGIMSSVPRHPSYIVVNGDGVRFMNESINFTHYKGEPPFLSYDGSLFTGYTGAAGYGNLPMYAVFDESCFTSGSLGNTHARCSWALLRDIYTWSEDNRAELEKGWITQAGTIEELATRLGLDATALAATVGTYNEYCATGSDPDFSRPGKHLKALTAGPYYAMELAPALTYTIGGLRNNEKAQTLDWEGNPIPRLYSGGNVGQGVFLLPLGIPGCMAQGRFAARDALARETW